MNRSKLILIGGLVLIEILIASVISGGASLFSPQAGRSDASEITSSRPIPSPTPAYTPTRVIRASATPTSPPLAATPASPSPTSVVYLSAPSPTVAPSLRVGSTPTVTVPSSPPTSSPASTATALVSASPTPPASEERFVVGGTGGIGVNLRPSPSTERQRIAALRDGTVLIALGPKVVAEGLTWRQVRDLSGRIGWVPDNILFSPVP